MCVSLPSSSSLVVGGGHYFELMQGHDGENACMLVALDVSGHLVVNI